MTVWPVRERNCTGRSQGYQEVTVGWVIGRVLAALECRGFEGMNDGGHSLVFITVYQ